MREMKNSGIEWIGEIPEDKELIRNKYFVTYLKGKNPQILNSECRGLPYIGASELDNTSGNAIYQNYTEDTNLPICSTEDILILWDGARAGLIGRNHSGVISSTIVNTIPNKKYINSNFWYFYLKGFEKLLYDRVNGTTIPHMNKNFIEELGFINFSISEQQQIAYYLDKKCGEIDKVINTQKDIIEKLKEYKQTVITEAVTKGINPNVEMKNSELKWINHIPTNWENRKMISILSMRVVDGPHESPELYDDGIPYISATAIENGKINFSLMRGYISSDYCDKCDIRYKPQLYDILVVKLGASTGQVAIVETNRRFNIWVPLAAIRCNEKVNPYFIYYAFQSNYFIKQMEISWTYGTQQTLGVKTIERLRVLVPPIEEQNQICNYLDKKCSEIDNAISQKGQLIDKLTEYKKSLIYECVTGKRKVA